MGEVTASRLDLVAPFRFDGKVAIVTGASYGLGVPFAEILASAGADVVVAARSVDRLDETARIVEGLRRKCLAVVGDDRLVRMGELPELVEPLLFLASSASSFITGTVLNVDGGWRASGGYAQNPQPWDEWHDEICSSIEPPTDMAIAAGPLAGGGA
jgi:NAD(P)-dependent dehydrogenase (short-subunit alcohol dehydrogenase family)